MKEIQSIVQAYKSISFQSTRAVLATVARVEGSSYRRTGARMLVLEDGTYLGGISGGCLEGDALRRAQKALIQNKPAVVTYDTTQDDNHQIGVGLGCNGIIDVLLTPLDPEDEQNPVRLLESVTGTRVPRAVISITGSVNERDALGKALLFENDDQFMESFYLKPIAENVLADIKECLAQQTSKSTTYNRQGESLNVFIEIILPVTRLMIYGGNYDVNSLLRISGELGWETTVITNMAKVGKAMFSLASRMVNQDQSAASLMDSYSAAILMAHDYKTDFNNLQLVLQTKVPYIGLLGPRKRAQKMFDSLALTGNSVSMEDLQRIFAPAGLDIGANTPEEIALSITAEIRSHFAGRNGMSLRLRKETIYGNQ